MQIVDYFNSKSIHRVVKVYRIDVQSLNGVSERAFVYGHNMPEHVF